ncbi:MAG: hypothetical protein ACQEQM_06700 [Thermoplasmatota archaeon]
MVEGKRGRIFLSSVLIVGVPILIIAVSAGDVLLSIMTLLFLILMYYTNKINPEPYRRMDLEKLKVDLFIWCMLPMLFGAMGAARLLDLYFYFVFRDIGFTALAAIFAFMFMLNMDSHTRFRPTRFFTIFFITISTIGMGTVIGITRFLTDQFLDTGYLGGNTHLMVYLFIVSLSGLAIGVNLRDYIESYEFFPLNNVGSDFKYRNDFTNHREEFLRLLNVLFEKYNNHNHILVSRVLQAGIFVTIIYGILIERWVIVGWSIFSLLFAVSPDLFKINTDVEPPSIVYLWITSVTFIYAFGRPMGFYRYFQWWPGVTHFFAGTLVAVLVFSFLVYLGWMSTNLYIPSYLIPVIVLLSIFPIGVVWEISEFYVDVFFGRRLQAGIEDTVYDLLCNFVGTVVSLIMIYNLVYGWPIKDRGKLYNPIRLIKTIIKRS